MYECGFVNAVVPFDELEAMTEKYAARLLAIAARPTPSSPRRPSSRSTSSTRASTWAASSPGMLESMGRQMEPDPDVVRARPGDARRGLTNSVRDNDEQFPPEWRLSQRGRAAE